MAYQSNCRYPAGSVAFASIFNRKAANDRLRADGADLIHRDAHGHCRILTGSLSNIGNGEHAVTFAVPLAGPPTVFLRRSLTVGGAKYPVRLRWMNALTPEEVFVSHLSATGFTIRLANLTANLDVSWMAVGV